ncbi:MAG: VTT domain-containing protein [Ignavibacteriae bacterium]|nr:VTT domain-containing protein [Ignavibacteriota bacterium]
MEVLKEIFTHLTDLEYLIDYACRNGIAYTLLTVFVFAETGMLVGFFLPGDSLLVTAGIFAARGQLDITLLVVLLITATLLGDSIGYLIGYKLGPKIFTKEKSFLFRKDYILKTKSFYDKYGGMTIVVARFMPIIRTFAATVAGVGQMKYSKFLMYDIIGGVSWVLSMTFIGYFLGQLFPGVVKRLELVIIIVVFVSLLPAIIKFISHKIKQNKEKKITE